MRKEMKVKEVYDKQNVRLKHAKRGRLKRLIQTAYRRRHTIKSIMECVLIGINWIAILYLCLLFWGDM